MIKNRIDDIEILRGMAVLIVVVFHGTVGLFTWQPTWAFHVLTYFGGWVGVDLFFSISGFVIGRSLLPRLQTCQDIESSFRVTVAFWIRRAWRLLPTAWLWLALILTFSIIFRDSGSFAPPRTTLEATIAAFLNLSNLRMIDHFHIDSGANSVYWSLSLEEQFYFILPLLVIFSRRFLIPILIFIVLLQLFQERTTIMAMHMFRCDGLVLGVLLAIWTRHPTYQIAKPEFIKEIPLKGTIPLLLLLSALLIIGSHHLSVVPYKFTWITIISATLVWVASYDSNVLLPRAINPIMLWLASRSYAIYLIHMPAFLLTRELWTRTYPDQTIDDSFFWHYLLTASLLIIILSEINYRFIEMPLRKRGAQIADRFSKQTTPNANVNIRSDAAA